jgi:hypothetical protein
MKLYVCYGTFRWTPRPGGHPCGQAYHALADAGHRPQVIRSYGFGLLPDFLNQTAGRREVKRLTGNNWGAGPRHRRRDRDSGIPQDHRVGTGQSRKLNRHRGCQLRDTPRGMAAPARGPHFVNE